MLKFIGQLTLGLLLVLILGSCAATTSSVREERAVSDVRAVRVEGSGTLIIEQGERETLTVEAPAQLLSQVISENRDGTLVLGSYARNLIGPNGPITYRLTVTDLAIIESTGSSEISAAALNGDALTVIVSGSGDVELAGNVDRQEVLVSGSGSYLGGDLSSAVATVTVSGSGDATVHATEQLDVTITGSGEVGYVGTPQLTQQIRGSGDLVQIGE
jgi:hypothetical protein